MWQIYLGMRTEKNRVMNIITINVHNRLTAES